MTANNAHIVEDAQNRSGLSPRSADVLASVFVTVVALLARTLWLGSAPPVAEELVRWDIVARAISLHSFWPSLFVSPDAPLGPALQIGLARLLGLSWIALRLPDAVAGSLAVAALHRLLGGSISRSGALAAALGMALSPWLVSHDRSARPTALCVLFALVYLGVCCSSALRTAPRRRLLAIAATAALLQSAYSQCLLLVAAFFSVRFAAHVSRRDWPSLRRDLLGATISVAACVPFLLLDKLRHQPWRLFANAADQPSLAAGFIETFSGYRPRLGDGLPAVAIAFALAATLVLPFIVTRIQRREVEAPEPALGYLWLSLPAVLCLIHFGADLPLRYDPTDYIAAAPFLLASWLTHLRAMTARAFTNDRRPSRELS